MNLLALFQSDISFALEFVVLSLSSVYLINCLIPSFHFKRRDLRGISEVELSDCRVHGLPLGFYRSLSPASKEIKRISRTRRAVSSASSGANRRLRLAGLKYSVGNNLSKFEYKSAIN